MRWPACLLLLFSVVIARSQDTVRTMFPAVRGLHEMVAAANNLEVAAGMRMLAQGGNAVDAGVATVLAGTVTEQSRLGLGGEIPILIKLKDKPVIAISGVGVAGSKATVRVLRAPRAGEVGAARAGRAHPRHRTARRHHAGPGGRPSASRSRNTGHLSFTQVAAPAIEYADEGFPIGEEFAEFLGELQPYHAFWPTSFRFFYPNGVSPKRGEIVKMPALANTLREMAAVEPKDQGRPRRQDPRRPRSVLQGRHRRQDGRFHGYQRRPVHPRRPGQVPRRNRRAPHRHLPRLHHFQARFLDAGTGDDRSAQHPGRLRPQAHGPQQPRISAHA